MSRSIFLIKLLGCEKKPKAQGMPIALFFFFLPLAFFYTKLLCLAEHWADSSSAVKSVKLI